PDRWSDVEELLGVSGEGGCWCQAWRGFDAKSISGGRSRPELLRDQMRGEPPAPGYIAYLGAVPVGWIGVSVRTETPRLTSSRTIPAIDDLPVWSIGCFQIRPGYRRRGIAKALLNAVVEAARAADAPGVEAYPIDPEGRRVEVGAIRRHCLDVRRGRLPSRPHDRWAQRPSPAPAGSPGPPEAVPVNR
ncbi:MAG: GNAT family N-acetyltransferase, partial [Candidatus Limnocylindria bacterium]